MNEPVDPINDKKREPNPIVRGISLSHEMKNQKAIDDAQGKQNKPKLAPIEDRHRAMSPPILADRVDVNDVKPRDIENPLGKKDLIAHVDIFGTLYKKDSLSQSMDKITNVLLEAYGEKRKVEVAKILKGLPKQDQKAFVENLINEFAKKSEGFTGFVKSLFSDNKVLEFFDFVMSDKVIGVNFSREERNVFLENVKKSNKHSYLLPVVDLVNKVSDVVDFLKGTFSDIKNMIIDDTKQINKMAQSLKEKKEISTDELLQFQKKAKKIALILKCTKRKISQLRKLGKSKQAEELNNIILTMEDQFQKFKLAATEYMNNIDDQNKKAILNELVGFVTEMRNMNHQLAGKYVSNNNLFKSLDNKTLGIINSSMALLDEAATSKPLDKGVFCVSSKVDEDSIVDLINGSYDLLQDLDNMKITIGYTLDKVFSIVEKDKEERAEAREKLLVEMRQLDKSLEQIQDKCREEEKKQDKVAQQKALFRFENTISTIKNLIKSIIDNNFDNAMYLKCQLEIEENKKILATILNMNLIT